MSLSENLASGLGLLPEKGKSLVEDLQEQTYFLLGIYVCG